MAEVKRSEMVSPWLAWPGCSGTGITRRGFLAGAAGVVGSMVAAEGLLARVEGAQAAKKNLVVGQSRTSASRIPN